MSPSRLRDLQRRRRGQEQEAQGQRQLPQAVDAPGKGHFLRIGQEDEAIERLVEAHGTKRWTLIA